MNTDQFNFKCQNNETLYTAIKNASTCNWEVTWIDYDGCLQKVTYLADEFFVILGQWQAVVVG